MILNGELESIWKEAAVVRFKIVLHNSPGGLGQLTKTSE
jgi:hypothetical protein